MTASLSDIRAALACIDRAHAALLDLPGAFRAARPVGDLLDRLDDYGIVLTRELHKLELARMPLAHAETLMSAP